MLTIILTGLDGDDLIFAAGGDDIIYGGAGIDFITAASGSDISSRWRLVMMVFVVAMAMMTSFIGDAGGDLD